MFLGNTIVYPFYIATKTKASSLFTQQYSILLSVTTLYQELQSNTCTELTLAVTEKLCHFPTNSVKGVNKIELEWEMQQII